MDLDAAGADISGENQINLSPSSGLDPSRVVRSVPTAATAVNPETLQSLIAPVSIELIPRGAVERPISPAPGKPVDLTPPNPAVVQKPMQLAQVVPLGDAAVAAQPGAPIQIAPQAPLEAAPPRNGPSPPNPRTVGTFGSQRPDYPVADPDVDPYLAAKRGKEAERDSLRRQVANPLFNFLNAKTSAIMNDRANQLDLEIGQIDQHLQQQSTNRQTAQNMGLTKTMPRTADAAAIHEEALREWKEEGNYAAYRGLQGAGQGARADLYMSEGINIVGKDVDTAAKIYDYLGFAKTQQEYKERREQALQQANGIKGSNFRDFGLTKENLPTSRDEFMARRSNITAGLRNAGQFVETYNQRTRELGQVQPIANKETAEATRGTHTFNNGEAIPNTQAVTVPGLGGAKGALFPQQNSIDPALYGGPERPGRWDTMSPGQQETITKQLAAEEVKGAIGQYKMAKAFHAAATNNTLYRSAAGIGFLEDALGAIGRDVAEGSKAAGSIGLVKIFKGEVGGIDGFLNRAAAETSAYKAWLSGGKKTPEPRLSENTIRGLKAVADFKMAETTKELSRVAGPIVTLGRYGGDLSKVGLDKETQDIVRPVFDAATQQGRLDIDSRPFINSGGRRVNLEPGMTGPNVMPAGSYLKTISNIPTTPPAAREAPSGSSQPQPGSSAATLPGGAGPAYATGIKAGESGNDYTKAPNSAGASGAYQFIKSTWNENKPEGAPDQAYKATAEQQDQAFANLTNKNALALEKKGIPVNPLTLAMAHQQGAAGGAALAAAPDDAKALDYVDRKAAANNKPFFWGPDGTPLTVAESKAKFAQFYRTGAQVGVQTVAATPPAAVLPYPNPKSREEAAANYRAGQRMTPEEAAASVARRNALAAQATQSAANIAPALGGTAGAVVGGLPGAAIGGAAGGAVKNYFTGTPEQQTIPGYGKAVGFGAAQGAIAGVGGPGLGGMATRSILGGAVPAAEKAVEGAEIPEITNNFIGGAITSAGIEGLGRGLGMAKHLIWGGYSGATKQQLATAAEVLSTQQPKVADATGKTVVNPAYEQAEKFIKGKGQDPEEMKYAYEQVRDRATRGEAFTQRPGELERRKAAAALEGIKEEVGASTNVVPPNYPAGTKLKDGPIAAIRTDANRGGTVPETFRADAVDAERRMLQPAASMGEKWGQLADVRKDLLTKERAAIAGNDQEAAKAMRSIADNVREHQENIAKKFLPKEQADALITHLKNTDVRYRNAIMAGGDDIVKTIAAGGAKGNQAREAFTALAHGDPTAQRMMASLVRAQNRGEGYKFIAAVGGTATGVAHFIPVVAPVAASVGITLATAKAAQMLKDIMVQRGAGKLVTMDQLLQKELSSATRLNLARGGAAVGSAVGAQAADAVAGGP